MGPVVVCRAIRHYRVLFWCRSFIQVRARWAWTVGCQSKSRDTISSGADCLRYHSGEDFRTISQYRLTDSSPRVMHGSVCLICSITWAIWITCVLETTAEHWTAFTITTTVALLWPGNLCSRRTRPSYRMMKSLHAAIDTPRSVWRQRSSDLDIGEWMFMVSVCKCIRYCLRRRRLHTCGPRRHMKMLWGAHDDYFN